MIEELEKDDLTKINELENSFYYVLQDVIGDLINNPFSHYLLFIDDNKILGYVNYYLMYDRIEIANFNVLEKYQNQHIGTKLLDCLINSYKDKVKNITLEVKKDNDAAIALYKKYDFSPVAVRSKYYNGVDGILMERMMK